MTNKKHYIAINSLIYFPDELTDEFYDEFIDEYLALVEKHEGQAAGIFSKKSEQELEEEDD